MGPRVVLRVAPRNGRDRGHAATARAAPQRGPCTYSMGCVLISSFLFSASYSSRMGFQSQWLY